MQTPQNFNIEALPHSEFDAFLHYLDDHLADNGADDIGYFQPLPRAAPHMPPERVRAFREGLQIPVSEPGWRRLWVARAANDKIAGHIDLRSHAEQFTGHRCLLGMGVQRDHRRLGLGLKLIAHAEHWVRENTTIEWIDLKVLSVNERAVQLYRRAGFATNGETMDMFQIDGLPFSYTSMTKKIA